MTITRYQNVHDIDVTFEDGAIEEHTRYRYFKNEAVKNLVSMNFRLS